MDESVEAGIAGDLRVRWAQAFAARDHDALVGLYVPEALFFGSTPQLFRGREGVRAYFAGLSPDVVLEAFEEPALERLSPGLFATAGFWRFRFGAEPRLYRLTWVVAERDGGWLIAQHHAARCEP